MTPHEEYINDRAYKHWQQGQFSDGIQLLNKYYKNSTEPYTLYNRSFFYLGFGLWPEGWHLYRNRQLIPHINPGRRAGTQFQRVIGGRGLNIEQCYANSLNDVYNRDLYFFHEQGLGDTLQFVRYAILLRPIVRSLTIAVPPVLNRLIKTMSFSGQDLVDNFTVTSGNESYEHCTVSMPMMDAPAFFHTELNDVPSFVPYFNVSEYYINKHSLPPTEKLRIGLVWKGASPINPRPDSIDNRRSMSFHYLEPLLRLEKLYEFVGLQLPNQQVGDRRLLQPLREDFDFLDTAAIVSQLDLIIAVDSSVAHLAGALGKPVWLLSRYDQCWRWLWDGRDDTVWYPSMRLFQQLYPGGWAEVIDHVISELGSTTLG